MENPRNSVRVGALCSCLDSKYLIVDRAVLTPQVLMVRS